MKKLVLVCVASAFVMTGCQSMSTQDQANLESALSKAAAAEATANSALSAANAANKKADEALSAAAAAQKAV